MKNILTLLMIFVLSSSLAYSQNSVKIQEFATLDSSSSNIVLGRQAIVIDNNNVIHLFYGVWGQAADSISEFTSSDNGVTWNEPEVVSIFSHSSTYTREHIYEISAAVDSNNNLHLVYRYDGPPYYISGWDAYPSSHINYVEKVDGNWTTLENVINDENVQAREGNGNTVCYLKSSQLLNYHNILHFISYDYAWWATKYHIIYSNNSNGSWLGGDTLHTYNLGDFDNIILNAPSLVVNNDTLFALWYQRYNCTVEMKKFDGNNWSSVQTVFKDKYFPAPHPTSYIVYTGSVQQNGTHSVTAMLRSVSNDYNELILLSKNQNSSWQVDTTQLNEKYYTVEPSIYKDTTYLYLYRNSTYTGSIIKFTKTNGFSEPIPMVMEDTTEQLLNIKSLSDASLPFAYIVKNTNNTYFLKIGHIYNNTTDVKNKNKPLISDFVLKQNYPNPFNPTTTIRFSIPQAGNVNLSIYNILGEKVAVLTNGYKQAGNYEVTFNAGSLSSGIYFYRLKAGNFMQIKKMILTK